VRTTDGFTMTVNPNELIGRHIYLTGEFDRSIIEILCNFSQPNDVLLDVGANIGYVSACFLKNVQESRAIAVEPQEGVLRLLRANLPNDRSTIVPCALSDTDGEVWFQTNKANNGAGRIVTAGGQEAIRIQTQSPDRLFAHASISRIDLVKIDAEGHEKKIIESCISHFDRLHPRAILFEDSADDASQISALLTQIGYKTFGIEKSLTSLSLTESRRTHDYIAVSTKREIPGRACSYYGI
jgi:FkbM family methyltransferase